MTEPSAAGSDAHGASWLGQLNEAAARARSSLGGREVRPAIQAQAAALTQAPNRASRRCRTAARPLHRASLSTRGTPRSRSRRRRRSAGAAFAPKKKRRRSARRSTSAVLRAEASDAARRRPSDRNRRDGSRQEIGDDLDAREDPRREEEEAPARRERGSRSSGATGSSPSRSSFERSTRPHAARPNINARRQSACRVVLVRRRSPLEGCLRRRASSRLRSSTTRADALSAASTASGSVTPSDITSAAAPAMRRRHQRSRL